MTGRALVTGGAGFIGGHLVERLLDDDHDVTVIDNFSTGRPENLAHLRDRPGLSVIEGDICEPGALDKAFDGAEWGFRLAGLAASVAAVKWPVP